MISLLALGLASGGIGLGPLVAGHCAMAMWVRALFASGLPPRLRRWRVASPLEAGIGATPHTRGEGSLTVDALGALTGCDEQLGGGL